MEPQNPPHTVIYVGFHDEVASLAIMCKGVRFYIEVELSNLRETGEHATTTQEEQFIDLRDNRDDPDFVEAFECWAIQPCLPYIHRAVASRNDNVELTVAEYFEPPTNFFRIFAQNGDLHAWQYEGSASDIAHLAPKVNPTDLINITVSQLGGIPRMKAPELRIAPEPENRYGYEHCELPRAVQHIRTGELLHFKASQTVETFSRELEVYLRVRDRADSDHSSIPKLLALVEWEERGHPLMGFVTEFIRNEGTLLLAATQNHSYETRKKWMLQVTETVNMLHGQGLVWGDVSPDNVLVDHNGDARVIDFEGAFSDLWVDQELAGTKEGDLQGLSRIKEYLRV